MHQAATPNRVPRLFLDVCKLAATLLQLIWKSLTWPAAVVTALVLIWKRRQGSMADYPIFRALRKMYNLIESGEHL